ncbi:MAG: transcription-repair coupling factor [Candidatus Marinimicrobia bacterium]|nr:transcription-repair coupling factor [Candidatus Neomarinimicrobiota bacterium]
MSPDRFFRRLSDALEHLGVARGGRLSGAPPSVIPLIGEALRRSTGHPLLVVVPDDGAGLTYLSAVAGYIPDGEVLYCPAEKGPDDGAPPGFSSPLEMRRKGAWGRLAAGRLPQTLVVAERTMIDGLPEGTAMRKEMFALAPGMGLYSELLEWLERTGYEPASLVTEPGNFAVRGGIIDLFPVNRPAPLRLDYFGDELQTLREFDIHSQISAGKIMSAQLLPAQEIEAPRKPVLDLYGGGCLMLQMKADGAAELSASGSSALTKELNLEVEIFEADTPVETIAARWSLFKAETSLKDAWYATERPEDLKQAAARLPGVPLQGLGASLPVGFASVPLGLFVVAPRNVHQRYRPQSWAGAAPSAAKIRQHVESLEPGDPLVHVNHGVGRYAGMTFLDIGGESQECLVLEYAGSGRIYVSTDKINLVQPYHVKDGVDVTVDSLDSKRWERIRRQTRRSAEEIVDSLAAHYADRMEAVGVAHPADDQLQADLEATFPYAETPDQLQAMVDINADMESTRPMDRLLCGDVGFGKTEVALRAAFKAIRGGGQVALMAPTTILANQHLLSFKGRLEPFAVNVGLLSRFVSPKQQRDVLRRLEHGQIDLLIGTHRLLSKDVHFKNLTLLIVDEEHRFGVSQKERVKELKRGLDVLSLTATPIPRTLHFSLAGIRDISRLDTPPLERVPIMTSIAYYDNTLIVEAINRELGRGGQVYFVHNEVRSIQRLAAELRDLLPEVSMAVAHGQMEGKRLERTMLDFGERKYQVLICTSIIESGIDLPNVNTVLINNAHRFGLAQIYQIRGRVGRSSRQGYAVLLIHRRPKLTVDALRRLKTIERYSALGSGYAIALKDLEIRGVGNIFGMAQSGHVAAVGLDLYSRIIRGILAERAAKTGHFEPHLNSEDVTVKFEPGASLPQDYVSDPHLRLNLFRRMAAFESLAEVEAFSHEMRDRFGPLPEPFIALLAEAALRVRCMRARVRSIKSVDAGFSMVLARPARPERLLETIKQALEPKSIEYRFSNMKQGDLQLHVTAEQTGRRSLTLELLEALAG